MADFKIYLTKMSLSYQGSEEEKLCGDLLFSEKDISLGDKRLNNLAAYTYNAVTCQKLFNMIEKALTPSENPWKTIYKALLLLHTIVLYGSELAIDKSIDICRFVRPLGVYNSALAKRGLFSGGGGTDYGAPVRMEAKIVDEILLTDASIRKARSDAREGQDSLVPMGDLLDDGSAAAIEQHNRDYNPSHGVSMNYGQGVTSSVGAGFGLHAVPGIYEGRPERYFDSDSRRKELLQPTSIRDSQITRDAQAPSLLDMVFEDTSYSASNLPPADYLPALERQRELEAQLLAQQEQLRQLQELQKEQQRLQELQKLQQQQQAPQMSFPFTSAAPPQSLSGGYTYGQADGNNLSGMPVYGQAPASGMGHGMGQHAGMGTSMGSMGQNPHHLQQQQSHHQFQQHQQHLPNQSSWTPPQSQGMSAMGMQQRLPQQGQQAAALSSHLTPAMMQQQGQQSSSMALQTPPSMAIGQHQLHQQQEHHQKQQGMGGSLGMGYQGHQQHHNQQHQQHQQHLQHAGMTALRPGQGQQDLSPPVAGPVGQMQRHMPTSQQYQQQQQYPDVNSGMSLGMGVFSFANSPGQQPSPQQFNTQPHGMGYSQASQGQSHNQPAFQPAYQHAPASVQMMTPPPVPSSMPTGPPPPVPSFAPPF